MKKPSAAARRAGNFARQRMKKNVRRGFGISVTRKYPERIIAMWEEMLSNRWS